ncbi:MAG: ferritin family protein [Candidatus Cloacimonetes bacterium]|nr:ferritin family protein [Candidatus Cloacimonadota bacterium]
MTQREELLLALKKAMQGEMDSVNLYKNAANHAKDPEVKKFFSERMNEEQLHYNHILEYYKQISNNQEPRGVSQELEPEKMEAQIFTNDFMKRIGEDHVLFSAISTALLLELRAMEHYAKLEAEQKHPTLKSFFAVMKKYEQIHYDDLAKIQKEAEEYYWQVNDWQPF